MTWFFLRLWLIASLATPIVYSHSCFELYSGPRVTSSTEPFPSVRRKFIERLADQNRKAELEAEKQEFERALLNIESPWRAKLRDSLEALRGFIDYRDQASILIKLLMNRGKRWLSEQGIQNLYDEGKQEAAYANVREANIYLRASPNEPSLERFLKVHAIAMKGGIESLARGKLGKLRNTGVVGEERDQGLERLQRYRINKSPYLSFEDAGRNGERYLGDILYPDPSCVKKKALDFIRETHPEVVERVEAYQEKHRGKEDPPEDARLTQDLLRALCEERYSRFEVEKLEIGPLTTPEKVEQYVRAVALLYRDIVSIHPVENGNGRTARLEVLFAPLDAVGIPRPRLSDPNLDILLTEGEWLDAVWRGIIATDGLYRGLTARLELGFLIEDSANLIYPDPVRELWIHRRWQNKNRTPSKSVEQNYQYVQIDIAQFVVYVATVLRVDRSLRRRAVFEPLKVFAELRESYKEFRKARHFVYDLADGGREEIGLPLVDRDFMTWFAQIKAGNKEHWDYKKERWYTDDLVWRGMADQYETPTRESVLANFVELGSLLLSERSRGKFEEEGLSPRQRVVEALKDMRSFNEDNVSGELGRKAHDHAHAIYQEDGGTYDVSYGYSTSAKRGTAVTFALGGLLIAETMDRKTLLAHPDQKKLKGRMAIGMYRGLKDVNLNRMSVFFPEFSSRSSRQTEQMGIGGADPDMVMVIQTFNEKGNVVESYVRNINNPHEVWIVKGDFRKVDGTAPSSRRLIETVDLTALF